MEEVLTLREIWQVFNAGTPNAVFALSDISLSVRNRDFLIILGANGSGKTTLLNAIASRSHTSGYVILRGRDITHLPVHKISRFVSLITQRTEEGTAGEFSIIENLALATLRYRGSAFRKAINESLRKEFSGRISALNMDLSKRIDSPVDNLSGGERQVICVLMALLGKPEVLLCDEPTAAIDVTRCLAIEKLVRDFSESSGIPVLWVTHDSQQALRLGNRLIVLKQGCILREFDEQEKSRLTATQISEWIKGLEMDDKSH